jgi:hypothetical protein
MKVHKRSRDCKRTVLAADLEDLIIRDPDRSLRGAHHQGPRQVLEVPGAGDEHPVQI